MPLIANIKSFKKQSQQKLNKQYNVSKIKHFYMNVTYENEFFIADERKLST